MKGFWGLPNHKDVWLPPCRPDLQSKHFQGALFLLFPFLLLPAAERFHLCPSEFGKWRAIGPPFVLLIQCSKVGYVMAPVRYVSDPFFRPSVAFLYNGRTDKQSGEVLTPSALTRRSRLCEINWAVRGQQTCKNSQTHRQTRSSHTCASAIKSLSDYLIPLNPECVYMTKTLALKLHQALRNAVQPEANRIERAHYNILEAAEHWCQLFNNPLVHNLRLIFTVIRSPGARSEEGERLATEHRCRGSHLFYEAPSAGQNRKKHPVLNVGTSETTLTWLHVLKTHTC